MGCMSSIGLPQQATEPSLALMHSTSVPQDSQWNRLPSWLATVYHSLLLLLHRLIAAVQVAFTAFGDDHFRAALRALVSLAYLVGHYYSSSPKVCVPPFGTPSGEYSATVTQTSTEPT